MSAGILSMEEACLLSLLKAGLNAEKSPEETAGAAKLAKGADLNAVCDLARRHGVLSLLYDTLAENEAVPEHIRNEITDASRKAVRQNYRLLFLSKYLIESLAKEGIRTAVLKGPGTASFYPVPELRKTGDVDILLLEPEKLKAAENVLISRGCARSDIQGSPNHVVFEAEKDIEVELHIMLAGNYDNKKVNRYLRDRLADCGDNITYADCMGVKLPILDYGYHAFELLLHMLQHFLRAGFGIKLLCDWTAFWNHDIPEGEVAKYKKLISDTGLTGFSNMVTTACNSYLGMDDKVMEILEVKEGYDADGFLREILDAEEFGKSAADRMVIMRGSGLADYVRELHHQMLINFPKAGKIFIIWPALWVATLVRFIYNNHKIRRVSTGSVLKKAGERSKVMKQIRLWK